ncbi:eukaryotic translation initiation factor mextil isoform X2 [Arctopsyche grandis]|uniref:eukaryotic translation initiation factor mextil isoform X2 n=1 Tax=Arctopsyche grandis TaxID=121162 RepID=UPI00406D9E8B
MATLAKMTRMIKKPEVPRPLKSTSVAIQTKNYVMDLKINSVDDLIVLTETVACELTRGNYDRCLQNNVALMYQNLKLHGAQLESTYKDLLDRFFVVFRNGSQDDNLDKRSRLHLLELIELRAKQWQENDNMSHYYKCRVTHAEPMLTAAAEAATVGDLTSMSFVTPASPVEPPAPLLLGPGEIIKTSGKFTKPTKIPGKNYSKDEVVIRNADSGKVMGIKGRRVHMIEELSDTIISFQRVSPGAKERLVQITGPNEENVNHAKHLIGDTIRRNASPVRLEGSNTGNLGDSTSSLNSSASEESGRPTLLPLTSTPRPLLHSFSTNDANLNEFRYTVTVGTHAIKITGDNLNIVNMAKLVLDDYFENFNTLETPVSEFGDVFSFNSRQSLDSRGTLGSQDYNSNGSEDTVRANGLPSPTDDDVFIKNSSESNTETVRRSRYSRGSSYTEKMEAERSVNKLSYSYEMLLHYANSPLSKQVPKANMPQDILRKASLEFNGELYLQKVMEGRQSINSSSEETKDSPEPE